MPNLQQKVLNSLLGLLASRLTEELKVKYEEEWLTTEEAAEYLKISPGSLRNMTSNGQVPFYKLARRNRYLKSELKDMLLKEKRGPGALSELESYPRLKIRR